MVDIQIVLAYCPKVIEITQLFDKDKKNEIINKDRQVITNTQVCKTSVMV